MCPIRLRPEVIVDETPKKIANDLIRQPYLGTSLRASAAELATSKKDLKD